jgi:hypothetical protein
MVGERLPLGDCVGISVDRDHLAVRGIEKSATVPTRTERSVYVYGAGPGLERGQHLVEPDGAVTGFRDAAGCVGHDGT